MRTLIQDLRYGLRMLGKSPGFTAVAVLTLALGIGANIAIFSVVNAALLRPLPYADPDRLVFVWSADKVRGVNQSTVSIPDLADWRQQNQVFEGMAAFSQGTFNLSGGQEPVQVNGLIATVNLLDVLGVGPELGRSFASNEEQWGKHRVVLLGHALWAQSFGSEPAIVGKTIMLNAEPHTVIGVLPPEASEISSPDRNVQLWVPAAIPPDVQIARQNRFLRVVARLKPDIKPERAQADMNTITARLEQTYTEDKGVTAYLVSARAQITGSVRPALLVLLGAVGFVLLIGCANIASLLLARSAERQTEFAIRAALGCGRLRLVRQLLTESVLLSLFGGALGVLLGTLGTRVLSTLAAREIPRGQDIRMDAGALGFALGLSLITGVFFGLAPALQWSKGDANEALKESGRGLASGKRIRWVHDLLVIGEMAMALVLLAGAGLLINSFRHLRSINPGFNTERVLTAEVSLPFSKYREDKQRTFCFQQLLERVKALPGVKSAGATLTMPLGGGDRYWMDMEIEGLPKAETQTSVPIVAFSQVTPGYLTAMGIPLLKGRSFNEQDNERNVKVALVSQATVRRYFPTEEVIGKRIRVNSVSLAVVGVVGDAVIDNMKDTGMSSVYTAHSQAVSGASGKMVLAIRTVSDPLSLAVAVRDVVHSLDKDQAVANVRTLEQTVNDSLGQPRLNTLLLAIFAALALVLAAIGIYGLLSYSVAQRGHEIGVRMALGAERRDIVKLVVRRGATLTLMGTVLGLVGAFVVTRLLATLLYGVRPTDLPTFLLVSCVLTTVAGIACYIPARRATKVDPMVALRYE